MMNKIKDKLFGKPNWNKLLAEKDVKFEDIQFGEVFAVEGCIEIHVKTGNRSAMHLADDWFYEHNQEFYNENSYSWIKYEDNLVHKLTDEAQSFWLVD